MKLTKESLLKIISEEKRKISREKLRKKEKETLNEAAMVSLQPIQRMERKEESLESKWMRIAGIDTKSLNEGDVVDLFPKDKPGPQDKDVLAKALAKRAMEMVGQRAYSAENMLDLDGDKDNINVNIDIDFDPEFYKIFLSPYIDVDGHGKEVPALVDYVYDNYVLGMAGDHAEKLNDIVGRIDIDYFDEDIITVMKSAGDDRFDDSSTLNLTFPSAGDSEMMKTKDLASQQDSSEVAKDDIDFAAFLDSLEQNVVEFPEED